MCGELSRHGVHAHFWIDQDVGGIGQDLLPPAIEWQGTLDKTIAKRGCHLCLAILSVSGVIAECSEPLTIQLAEPAFDRKLPIGMMPEKSADDAYAHWLRLSWWCGQGRWRVALSHGPAHETAINGLEIAIVVALISEQERLSRANSFRDISEISAAIGRLA